MIGAAITFILLEILLAGRREKEAEQREKERLILQMGSPFHESAIEAARQLHARGWLEDGSLREALLFRANLKEANLVGANLQDVFLAGANLQLTKLGGAKLQGAILMSVDLQGADLHHADLRGAHAITIDQLRMCKSLRGTTLPDGTRLPYDDTWHHAFEAWSENSGANEYEWLMPAPPDEPDDK